MTGAYPQAVADPDYGPAFDPPRLATTSAAFLGAA